MDALEGLTENLDSNFKMWGDQALSTVGILRNVSSALSGTNVGFKGQVDIVEALTNGIKGMSLGMRSFIGMQAGFRGGAVSAGLQVEKLMQEGKMDQIVDMMQKAIQQKSGRGAVSLGDAIESPDAQRAFMVQRGMLGNFGVSDVGTQNRILEAMSKTQLGGGGKGDVEEILKGTLEKGNDIQERQNNNLINIAENTTAMKDFFSAQKAYETERAGKIPQNEMLQNVYSRQRSGVKEEFNISESMERAGVGMAAAQINMLRQNATIGMVGLNSIVETGKSGAQALANSGKITNEQLMNTVSAIDAGKNAIGGSLSQMSGAVGKVTGTLTDISIGREKLPTPTGIEMPRMSPGKAMFEPASNKPTETIINQKVEDTHLYIHFLDANGNQVGSEIKTALIAGIKGVSRSTSRSGS
jgi:hypothetical protein